MILLTLAVKGGRVKSSHEAVLEANEASVDIAHAGREERIPRARRSNRSRSAGAQKDRYRMRCPRCALGLVEIVPGPVAREKCTTCNATWYDPAELRRIAKNDRTGFFQLFE